jgi:pimeloyl-ACP methyl ester carboxylesterase
MAEIGTKASSAIGGVARALPVLSYPLAGYSMGTDVGAIQEELAKERPDYADIALRGIGALGTGLSLHPVTAPVGIPMATIPPLIAAGRRKMREQPEMPEATYQEMVEASRPSFRMSRP